MKGPGHFNEITRKRAVIDSPGQKRLSLIMPDLDKIAKELSEITHEFNNLLNTLNGYTELALESKNLGNEEEYNFFKDKVFATISKKLSSAKELADRLNKMYTQVSDLV
jgi:signal transduction histidine kinase